MRNVTLISSMLRDGADETVAVADPKQLSRLATVEEGMRQMALLLRRWMEGQRQPQALHRDPRTLEEVVKHAVSLFQPAMDALRIEVTLRLDEAAAKLAAGPIYPVLANGLRNAIEAISQARTARQACGRIEIMAALCEGRLSLTVTDDGPGIDADLLDERGCFRLGKTTKASGHGLGLALCRDIAANLGGTLTLRNAQPQGAVLALNYPVKT